MGTAPKVRELLGRPRFLADVQRRTRARRGRRASWTPAGGDVLFVEASAMPGSGRLTITGQLGDVMKESGKAALSYMRRGTPTGYPRTSSRPRHPRAACPRARSQADGPSGTMATALMSLVSERRARRHGDDGRAHAERPGPPIGG